MRVGLILRICLCASLLLLGRSDAINVPADWQTYTSAKFGFSISYPRFWQLEAAGERNYVFFEPHGGPPQDDPLTLATIHPPGSMSAGTNLSPNSGVAVQVASASRCSIAAFIDYPQNPHEFVEEGVRYTVASMNDAGAGNFYETIVFLIMDRRPCLAVTYTIHSTNIGNYDPGTVVAFDRAALLAQFDRIRRTLVVYPPVPVRP